MKWLWDLALLDSCMPSLKDNLTPNRTLGFIICTLVVKQLFKTDEFSLIIENPLTVITDSVIMLYRRGYSETIIWIILTAVIIVTGILLDIFVVGFPPQFIFPAFIMSTFLAELLLIISSLARRQQPHQAYAVTRTHSEFTGIIAGWWGSGRANLLGDPCIYSVYTYGGLDPPFYFFNDSLLSTHGLCS